MGQLGEMLRSAREAKGVSLAQAEAATMIRRRYLQALEDDEPEILPGAVYTKGFIRNYGIYLGLDPNHLLSLYHREYPAEERDVVFQQPTIRPRGTRQLVSGGTVASFLLVIVLSIFAVYAYRQVQSFKVATPASATAAVPTPTSIPPTPVASATVMALAPPLSARSTPTPFPAGTEVTAKISQDAWMQVQVDGQPTFEGILRAGQTQTWKGRDDVFVWVGNAGGVNIIYNGKDIGPLGGVGEVVKKDFKKANS